MVAEKPYTAKKDLILLVQTQQTELERHLFASVNHEDIHCKSITDSEEAKEGQDEQIITFVIGSDVEDPIQSAQRLHARQKNAKIILLAAPDQVESLRETIKFSPFIGVDVFCFEESSPSLHIHVNEILQDSMQALEYEAIKQEANLQLTAGISSPKPALNQQFINKLMDVAPIGIAIVGSRGKIHGWNKEASLIFDRSEAQVLGKSISGYFGSKETSRLRSYLKESFGERKSEPITVERTIGDSSKQVLSFTAAPFWISDGNEKALILAFKDITERRKAQEELQEVNKTLEERVKKRTRSLLSYQKQLRSLASKLSKAEEKERHRLATELHDNLGQLLAVNKMKMDLLPKAQLPDNIETEIEEIKKGMDHAIVYTRNLMSDLKPPPSLDKEDVRASIEWVANKMEKHDLEVTIEDDGHSKEATEEIRTTLLQAVRELLFNVVKHSGVKKASIKMSRLDDRVQILVQDQGQGFDTPATEPAETDGFGLFNIMERIDLLGGKVEIDSKPGMGTKVLLDAPLKLPKRPNPQMEESRQSAGTSGKKIRVMLVDDHKVMREGLKNIVDKEEDMNVVAEASDGREAVELARETSPDVIIMDVNMPHMDGIEATQQIKKEDSTVRVVGLSLHEHKQVVESMRNAGATAYISKSEAFETLSATIRSEANPEEG